MVAGGSSYAAACWSPPLRRWWARSSGCVAVVMCRCEAAGGGPWRVRTFAERSRPSHVSPRSRADVGSSHDVPEARWRASTRPHVVRLPTEGWQGTVALRWRATLRLVAWRRTGGSSRRESTRVVWFDRPTRLRCSKRRVPFASNATVPPSTSSPGTDRRVARRQTVRNTGADGASSLGRGAIRVPGVGEWRGGGATKAERTDVARHCCIDGSAGRRGDRKGAADANESPAIPEECIAFDGSRWPSYARAVSVLR